PLAVLRQIKGLLRRDGYLIVSIPNVAHGSVRLALLGGAFPYGEKGLLDSTHLRFFTRESAEELFERAGFAVGYLERQEASFEASEVPYDPAGLPAGLVEALADDPDALTY